VRDDQPATDITVQYNGKTFILVHEAELRHNTGDAMINVLLPERFGELMDAMGLFEEWPVAASEGRDK